MTVTARHPATGAAPTAPPGLAAVARLAAHVCGTGFAVVELRGGAQAEHAVPVASHGTDPGPAAVSATAPLVTGDGHEIGRLVVRDFAGRDLDATQRELLNDLADQAVALVELRRATAALERAAGRDPLTDLPDRRSVEAAIAAAIARAERGLGTPSVVIVDLDGFEQVNASLGQSVGDEVLRSVAERLVGTSRAVDTVGRLGGDEFVVLLESTGGPGATAALRRLRDSLAEGWEGFTGGAVAVSASLGITTYRPGDRVASLLARADAEMYADKTRRAATL
jgi:diguanylate cyclase (GGDEF)-like protein